MRAGRAYRRTASGVLARKGAAGCGRSGEGPPRRFVSGHRLSATPEALPATLAAISAAVEADVQPRTSWRANRDFRMHIIRTLAERVIARCVVRAVELQEAASC